MNKSKKVIKPNVVGGGVAIPLGNNFYFMRGRKHEQGGIDVGPNNKNGLEVEGGEVIQMGGKHVKVYSSLPILNGKSPAQLVMAGLNPNKVFNAQERFKDVHKLNDDGTRKAKYGIKKKLADKIANRVHADGFTGGTNGVSDALNQMILNKDGDPIKRIKEIDDVNTKVENGEPLTEDEELIYKSDVFPKLNMIKQHKDALHLYLGKPQVYDTMEISPYQGIVSKDKKTYQINGVLSDNFFENNVVDDYAKWKSGGGKNVDDLGKTAQLHDVPYMNNAGMSEGYDKDKGHYISVFDTWDYNRKVAGVSGDNVGKFIGGKPFDLYHRFYLDEWNDIPEQYKGTKWLPDMVVKPNGYHTETIDFNKNIDFDASSGGFKYGGSRKARFGKRQKAEFGLVENNNKMDTLGNRLLNNNPMAKAAVQLIDPTGITSSNDAYDAVKGFIKDPSINSFGNAAVNVLGAIPGAKYFTGVNKARKLVKTANTIGDINTAVNAGNNIVNSNKPMSFKLGGSNRHYTINGNIVNKAGYVPSTGELPKANLGAVKSVDRHASKMDKNGLVSKKLMEETKIMIEQGKINKEKREETKRKELEELPTINKENVVNSEEKTPRIVGYTTTNSNTGEETFHNITTNKDGEKEINVIIPKEKVTVTHKPELFKSRKKEKNKEKTNTNNLNINSLYPNRFGDLTNPTIKLEGNDVPLSALPQLAVEAVNRKLKFSSKKDVDPESTFLSDNPKYSIKRGDVSKISEPIEIDELLSDALGYAFNGEYYTNEEYDANPYLRESYDRFNKKGGKIKFVDGIERMIEDKKSEYPAKITGDTIMYTGPSNMGGRRYYLPQSIDLSSVKGGYRNRGDYRDIETQGLVLPTMHEFYRFGDLNQETIKLLQSNDSNNLKGLIGVDKEGNIKVGRFGDFNEDDVVSVVAYDNIRGFNKNSDGTIKWAPRSDKWSDKYVFTETTSINPITGKDETGSVNVGGSRANPTDKAYGFLNGGHVVIKAGDEVRLISGSVSDIDKEIEKMKIRNNVDNVEFFMLDNGTYNLGLRTTDGVLKASDLKRYDNQNTGGGHGIYLKRLGGMNKRQKAEGGKNIFSPRGLGIQASMTKMQADAWDEKHPGEYNPFAQIFIDDFGDPTIYNPIMSDDANARRLGIDRGYKGNRGLGWSMPELPNINLDNYFNAQGNYIARADGGGSAGSRSGVSDRRRPEVKQEPLKPIIVKPKGVTIDTVKPPTQLTIKTPEIETKNKGTWWRDNGSDLISGIAKGGASLASYLINRNMLNDLKYTGQPIFTPAAKLKTKININPQIDAINRTTAARNANVSANTASSKVRNVRMNNNYIDRLGYLNELYGMKENKETELINADKLNQQEITKGNIQAYNDWVEKKQNFDNTVREKQSENAVSFVSNLASGVDDILTNRQKRKQFKQNIAAYMASHPNVSPELLESYGLDIFGNSKKTKKQVSATTKKTTPRVYTKEELDLIKTVKKVNSEYIKELESAREFRNRQRILKSINND